MQNVCSLLYRFLQGLAKVSRTQVAMAQLWASHIRDSDRSSSPSLVLLRIKPTNEEIVHSLIHTILFSLQRLPAVIKFKQQRFGVNRSIIEEENRSACR